MFELVLHAIKRIKKIRIICILYSGTYYTVMFFALLFIINVFHYCLHYLFKCLNFFNIFEVILKLVDK